MGTGFRTYAPVRSDFGSGGWSGGGGRGHGRHHSFQQYGGLATVLFVIRDIGFVYAISLKHETGTGNADARAFLYLVVAYTLLPALAQTLDLTPLLAFFWPQWGEAALLTIVPPLMEVAVIGFLLRRRLASLP